ncbi:sensor domain-containing diguanylate cyclase [Microvirga rosea]|uniref:sensor domain-containing diguanylate cyclase n=1 Tax=Microvirga rosea TaxID=2715425 RepID=UPI001D0A9EE3|nr:diguanylate cyclase [Microvirga rosea]MCB8821021.1 diguanylate cyclase [Microvirga rosea]
MFVVPPLPENEAERLDFLYSCGIMDTPKDARFDRLTRLAALFYRADVAFIGFIDDKYQWMKSMSADKVAPWIERDKSVCQLVIASGEPLVIGDMKTDSRLAGHPIVPHLPFRFYAGVPLLTDEGAAVASLCVLKREAQDTSDFDLTPLEDLSAIAMDELELWRRNADLARLVDTDALTKLANRRGFDTALDRAVRRARRTEKPLALLLLDLDFFKRLNDTLGHPAGDEVLRRFGGLLGQMARRPDDVAARYGGEEFALILGDTDAAGAETIAHELQGILAEAAMAHPEGIDGRVSVSIGIACLNPGTDDDADRLVARADQALYVAKQNGRARCSIYQ